MSAPPPIEPFTGKDWTECSHFIVAIRNRARYEGKLRDPEWMADLASVNFFGKALLWHHRLPQDVRGDWEKLEGALLEKWTPPDSDDEAKIEPTPAAAPVANTSAQSNPPIEGIIRVLPNDSNKSYYASCPSDGNVIKINADCGGALQVRFDAIPGTDLLRAINKASLLPLPFIWGGTDVDFSQGSTEYGWILRGRSEKSISNLTNDLTCTVSSTGKLDVIWRKADGTGTQLSAFTASSTKNLYFVVDPVAYGKKWTNEKKATLFVEPIE